MKKRGFTLIELLAVIVILAILALITVPIVLKLVNNARRDSSIRSAENYLDGVKKAVMNDAMNSEVEFDYCEVQSNGNILCNEKYTMQIDVDGSKPTKGTINFGGGTISDVEDLKFGKYYISGEVNSLVASTKSSDQDREPGEFLVGDKVTYKGERYYVIRKATESDEYLTLMKMYPLTKDEVVEYGLDSSGVNRAYKYESGSRSSWIGSRNGYGIVPYYSGDRCGYGYYCEKSGCEWKTIETNCANSYDQSDIKVIVDNWAKDNLVDTDLVESDGYKVRLLSDNDLTEGLKFSTEPSGGWSTGVYFRTTKTPKWVSNGDFYYWLMNTDEDTRNSAHIMGDGYVFAQKVNENGEWSAGAVRPVINVLKASLTEENAKASGLNSNKLFYSICKSTDGAATPTVGGKYECEVKPGTTFNFYVLSTNSGQIDMIMDRNICENGQAATDANPCLYAWDSETSENYRGPRTAMEKLYKATKDWDNIPYIAYDYSDENRQNSSGYGYTKIQIKDSYIKYIDRYGSSYNYNYPDNNKKMKARLITYKEIYNKTSCDTNSGSCKTWLTKNLNFNQPGYWSLSSSIDKKRFYNAMAIDNTRRRTSARVNNASYGIRPVIRLSTSNLRQGEAVQQETNLDYNYTQDDIQKSNDLASPTNSNSACADGSSWDFEYTGNSQVFEVACEGIYKLEVWGAQGGYRSNSSYGGKGGYSIGTINLSSNVDLYIYVGGSGNTGGTSGGFNGGGKRSSYNGGGGATDIRINSESLYARVIVAGGGGSDGATSKGGGFGGGSTAGNTTASNYGTGGYGGTINGNTYSNSSYRASSSTTSLSGQSCTYAGFGFGGNGPYYASGYGGAGGGGWYGGVGTYPDGSVDDDKGGGGGSGYVYTSSTASSYPSGCLLNSAYYLSNASTIAGNQSFASPSGGTETGHSGNGYARITYLGN